MKELLEGLRIARDDGAPAVPGPRPRRRLWGRAGWRAAAVAAAAALFAAASGFVVFARTRPALVKVVTVTRSAGMGMSAPLLSAGGYVRDPKVVYVAPKVAGRIASLSVREGDVVQAGDLLALIDSRDLDQEAAEARANLDLAAANLRKLEAGSRPEEIAEGRARAQAAALAQQRAEREAGRLRKLFDAGFVSAQQLDQAETEAQAGERNLDAVRQSLRVLENGPRREEIDSAKAAAAAARARLATALNRVSYTEVRAPVAGRVLKKYRNVGDFVSPDVPFLEGYETIAVGSPVVALAALGDQEVAADINETDIAKVSLGQRVELSPNAYPGEVLHGRVTQVSPRADKNKNTLEVRVTLEKAARVLPYDMSVKLTFLGAPDVPAPAGIRVPASAVVSRGGKSFVLVASGSRASLRAVEPGGAEGDVVVVKSGLAEGDRVIAGSPDLKDGAPIRLD